MSRTFTLTAAAAALLAIMQTAMAQEITAQTVVVTGSRTQEDLLASPASLSVVRPEQGVKADNIPDMLQDVSSVNLVSDGTPGVKHISIRGENASRTLLMVDGQRIDDSKTKTGTPLLANPFFVERIEVLKGPSSVLYGSDAMGGIVNVISKQPSAEPVSVEGGVQYTGSNNGFAEYVNAGGTLGKFSYAAGVFNTDAGDLYLADRERLDNTSYYSKGVNLNLFYALTDEQKISLVTEVFDLNANTSTTTQDQAYSQFRGHIPKWRRVKYSLAYDGENLTDFLSKVHVSVYTQDNDKDFTSQVARQGPYVFVNNEQSSYGANVQLEWDLGDYFYLITGYDGRREELDSHAGADQVQFMPGTPASSARITDSDHSQDNHALYALLDTYLTDSLTLSTGVRLNYVENKAGDSSLSAMGRNLPQPHSNVSDTHTAVSAGLVWSVSDMDALRFNYSQGFRMPNMQELYLTTFTGEMQKGNPDLKPETSDNFEIGFRHEGDALTADASVFYSKAKDYIETYLMPAGSGGFGPVLPVYSYRNIAEATTYGVELSVAYQFEYLKPYADVTWLRRQYDLGDRTSDHTGTPRLKGKAGVRLDDTYQNIPWYLDTFVRFATHCTNSNLDGQSYFEDSDFAGYATVNAEAGMSFGDKEQFRLYAGVDNLFDRDYQVNELIAEPGRFFYAGMSAKF